MRVLLGSRLSDYDNARRRENEGGGGDEEEVGKKKGDKDARDGQDEGRAGGQATERLVDRTIGDGDGGSRPDGRVYHGKGSAGQSR